MRCKNSEWRTLPSGWYRAGPALPQPWWHVHRPQKPATGADCNTYRYWLLLLSLGRTWCEILRATRLCLFLARGECFGYTWRSLLVTWLQSGMTRCGAGFAFSCVLRGGWESKECSSNDDRYDARHCQLLLVVCASEGQECRTKTARM